MATPLGKELIKADAFIAASDLLDRFSIELILRCLAKNIELELQGDEVAVSDEDKKLVADLYALAEGQAPHTTWE